MSYASMKVCDVDGDQRSTVSQWSALIKTDTAGIEN